MKCLAGWSTNWNQDCWENYQYLRYAGDTTLTVESEELKSLLKKVKEESEKIGLKLNIQKTKIMASGDWCLQMFIDVYRILTLPVLEKAMATHSSVLAWRIPRTGEPGGLPSMGSHRVGHDWSNLAAAATFPVYRCFTLLANNMTAMIDTEAEIPIFWPPDAKNWLIWKDPNAGKDWKWEEKGTIEDEMAGWYHQLDGYEFELAPGVGDGQRSLACYSPWVTESGTTEWLNWILILIWQIKE